MTSDLPRLDPIPERLSREQREALRQMEDRLLAGLRRKPAEWMWPQMKPS